MFINIIQSFLKIAFLALLLVIAFALAFYMLFFEPDEMVSISYIVTLLVILSYMSVDCSYNFLLCETSWTIDGHSLLVGLWNSTLTAVTTAEHQKYQL